MKKLLVLLSSVLVFASTTFAGEYSCPETHPEYNKVLKELETFKQKLKDELKCQEIAIKFDKLTDLLGSSKRNEFLSLIASNTGDAVGAEDAQKIQEYASSVTEEVGVLVSMISAAASGEVTWGEFFLGTDKCSMEEADELEGIERLTKAAYEATNLISKVSGPYGVPIQIAADTFYGVVQGLRSYSNRARHIDFTSFEKRQFFESAVCMMSKFDSDIRKLNNPEAHLRNLEFARDEAQRVVQAMSRACVNCTPVLGFLSDEEVQLHIKKIAIDEATKVEKILQGKASLEWIEKEIDKFKEIADFKTGGIGPRELQSLKNQINKFILGTAAPDFLKWYAVKAKISNSELSDSIAVTVKEMRRDFAKADKVFNTVLPESLGGKKMPRQKARIYKGQAREITNLYYLSRNKNQLNSFSAIYYSMLGQTYDLWKLSDFNIRVVQEYCSFFENTLQYNKSIERSCEEKSFVWQGLKTGYHAFYLADLINGEKRMSVVGPFDFRLEDHYGSIQKYKQLTKGHLDVAEAGISFAQVLNDDKSIRQQDGRGPLDKNTSDSAWWLHTKQRADGVILDFYNL